MEGGALDAVPGEVQGQVAMDDDVQAATGKRPSDGVRLPTPVKQRVADVKVGKRSLQEGGDVPAKFAKFDPNKEVPEPSQKQLRTALYSPPYAGNVSGSPATSSAARHVRRVIDELELHDEDEVGCKVPQESWDWELSESSLQFEVGKVEISEAEQRLRRFFDEGAGPPEVSPEDLAWLDAEAMQVELDRLKALDVIGSVNGNIDASECTKLDTKLVRHWRLRDAIGETLETQRCKMEEESQTCGPRIARWEFQHHRSIQPYKTFAVVKMLIVLSLAHDLAVASLDVGDAFLQVPQLTTVVIEIPRWALQAADQAHAARFWIPKRFLPGQRAAASDWNKFFIEVCQRYDYENFQSTIVKHKTLMSFISVHIVDLLVIGSKEHIENFHEELSKELKLKIEGPLQCGDDGSVFYLKRELQFTHDGIFLAPSSRYIPKLAEILKIHDRRGKTAPHHGCLEVFDADATQASEFFGVEDAKFFRPTKIAMSAIKKLASYLVFSKDMTMHYDKVELFQTTMQRWYGQIKQGTAQYDLEFYSDSVTEGLYVKQVVRFLVNDKGGLSNQEYVSMRLRLDSTSAQAFFTKLGLGKAKHLSTRLLWKQQAMRELVCSGQNIHQGESS
eukprot:s7_g71.t1